ncbi:hypothetical protein K1X22_28250 [Mycolicibacterium farcinogenes]|uniref:hypothetical protein n=1 Tax=Mycolicibacterium farcinogenes TaxID=1802 RepID=UPI001C8E7723|nr:hypothetical protein [Mycolicibacterium farcinogenes]QZH59982.1 hypothetical protein K1X22_28250 [Mycolicibacterium farcinogenes]
MPSSKKAAHTRECLYERVCGLADFLSREHRLESGCGVFFVGRWQRKVQQARDLVLDCQFNRATKHVRDVFGVMPPHPLSLDRSHVSQLVGECARYQPEIHRRKVQLGGHRSAGSEDWAKRRLFLDENGNVIGGLVGFIAPSVRDTQNVGVADRIAVSSASWPIADRYSA